MPVTPEIGSLPTLNGTKDITINLGDDIDYLKGVSASDIEDGNLTNKIIIDDSKVNYNKTGSYLVTYIVIDSDGNKVEKTITLTIKRNMINPVIPITPGTGAIPTLSGTKDITINLGDDVDYLKGVNASDIEDGNLTSKIIIDDSRVNYDKTGSYLVTYIVIDSDGNKVKKTITLTIKRNIIKPIIPIIPSVGAIPTINGTKDITIMLGNKVDLLAGISASDAEDGDLTSSIIVDDSKVDYNKAGVYEVTYIVIDSNGNKTIKKVKLTIKELNVEIPLEPETPNNSKKDEKINQISVKKISSNDQEIKSTKINEEKNRKLAETANQTPVVALSITILSLSGAVFVRKKIK